MPRVDFATAGFMNDRVRAFAVRGLDSPIASAPLTGLVVAFFPAGLLPTNDLF
jgi:hypothetical protein